MGGQLVLPGRTPVRADVAINYDDAVARTGGRVADVGDLREAIGIDTVDAGGQFLHPRDTSLTTSGRDMWLRIGAAAVIDVRRRADPGSELVRTVGGGRVSVSSP